MRRLKRVKDLEARFPKLKRPKSYGWNSEETREYNCIAFAAGIMHQRWCPYTFWKKTWPKGSHFQILRGLYQIECGYRLCSNGDLEEGIEKIAIYANEMDEWTHAAHQLADGWWESKMGEGVDIIHEKPEDLESITFGTVKLFLSRSRTGPENDGLINESTPSTSPVTSNEQV